MTPRETLAKNLRTLMAAHGLSIKALSARSGISNGTVGRIVAGQVGTSVDQLNDLAAAFELKPWQLLLDSLAVVVDGAGKPSVTGSPWPFRAVDERRYAALDAMDRGVVQAKMQAAIEEREQAGNGARPPAGASSKRRAA